MAREHAEPDPRYVFEAILQSPDTLRQVFRRSRTISHRSATPGNYRRDMHILSTHIVALHQVLEQLPVSVGVALPVQPALGPGQVMPPRVTAAPPTHATPRVQGIASSGAEPSAITPPSVTTPVPPLNGGLES